MHKFNEKCKKNIKEIKKEHKIFQSIKIFAKKHMELSNLEQSRTADNCRNRYYCCLFMFFFVKCVDTSMQNAANRYQLASRNALRYDASEQVPSPYEDSSETQKPRNSETDCNHLEVQFRQTLRGLRMVSTARNLMVF